MQDEFDPIAMYRAGMTAEITTSEAKIAEIEVNPVFGAPYKEFAIAQLNRYIAQMKNEIVGFDRLVGNQQ